MNGFKFLLKKIDNNDMPKVDTMGLKVLSKVMHLLYITRTLSEPKQAFASSRWVEITHTHTRHTEGRGGGSC